MLKLYCYLLSILVSLPIMGMEKPVQRQSVIPVPNDIIREGFLKNLKGSSLPESVKNIQSLAHSNAQFLRSINSDSMTLFLINYLAKVHATDAISVALALKNKGAGLWLKDCYPIMKEPTKDIVREAFVKAATEGKAGLISFVLAHMRQLVNQSVIRLADGHLWADEPALINAAQNGHTEVVRMLIEAGANVCYKDRFGYTSLHRAAREGHREIVKLLLDAGAGRCMIDTGYYNGCDVLDLAKGHVEMVDFLKSRMGWMQVFSYWVKELFNKSI